MTGSNVRLVDFQGNFDIQYIPDEKLSKLNTYRRLPITVRMVLGDEHLGLNGSEYQSAGYSFCPADYLGSAISIQSGERKTINLHERYSIPITFAPKGNHCLVKLERDQIGGYVSFDKNKVKDQVVPLDETVFRLANIMNEFLFDLDKKQIYSILDELEMEVSPLISGSGLGRILADNGSRLYQFKSAESTHRALDALRNKQKIYRDYDEFMESLNGRQSMEWDRILMGLRVIDSAKSDAELYQMAEIKPQVRVNQ